VGLTNTPDLLPGTLDLLILRAIAHGPHHGYGIADRIRVASDDVLLVGESALYPALQRLLAGGYAKAEWGSSDNNRRARFYTITPAGRKRLLAERTAYDRMAAAITRVMQMT
jgi:transcriptional regulator